MGMSDEVKYEHPSFGIISIDRTTSSQNETLFASNILHRQFITLNIHRAILHRNLNQDWVMADHHPSVISIEMSLTQFADAITSLNTSGVPCTIKSIEGHRIADPIFTSQRGIFDNEFEKHMAMIADKSNEYYREISKILNKDSIGKNDRKEILKQLDLLKMQIESNIPFIKKKFTEQMDETIVEAKNQVLAFTETLIRERGLQGFTKDLKSLQLIDKEDKTNG